MEEVVPACAVYERGSRDRHCRVDWTEAGCAREVRGMWWRLYPGIGQRLGARGMWGEVRGGGRKVRRSTRRDGGVGGVRFGGGIPRSAAETEMRGREVRWRHAEICGGDRGARGGRFGGS